MHGGAARAVSDEHLAHSERLQVADHLSLLLCQLEGPDVAEQPGIVVGVEPERADFRNPDEALAVERDATAAREGGDRLGRELVPCEGRHVRPAHRRKLGQILR